MEQTPSLPHAWLFLAVAEAGGLAGAARATGVSVPTLSRKMAELERQTGNRLFARGARGYALTASGRAFWELAKELRPVVAQLQAFSAQDRPVRVGITAGLWTSGFLARHIAQVWAKNDPWVPEFLPSDRRVDIARREADIGIRNTRPDQDWLAGRQTATIHFAPFGATAESVGWVVQPEAHAIVPSQRWVWETHKDQVVTTAMDARLCLDLALAGVGQVVLPVFVAQGVPGLVQTGPIIDGLTHQEWLVSHHEARHDPAIRLALDAVAEVLTDRRLRPTEG